MGTRAVVKRRLAQAVVSSSLIRVHRSPRNADTVSGFPLSLGAKWILIAAAGDGGYLDGLVAVRLKDITKVQQDSSFEERFAQTQPEWPPTAPVTVDLATTRGLIKDLNAISPLIGIEQEGRYSSEMRWIGIVDEVGDGWLWLHEVRPDATWRKQPRGYRLKDVTKVVVADRYQTALHAIAGSVTTAELA